MTETGLFTECLTGTSYVSAYAVVRHASGPACFDLREGNAAAEAGGGVPDLVNIMRASLIFPAVTRVFWDLWPLPIVTLSAAVLPSCLALQPGALGGGT